MGPKRLKTVRKRSSFQWTSDMRLSMAEYVRANYDSYKKALGSQKKILFLRKMRDELQLQCDDTQLKNGFTHFLQKYNEVESKLAQSGFGVNPEKDATLDKGWILKQCPYYDILNEVMGTRPNICPPFVISTSTPKVNSESENEVIDQNHESQSVTGPSSDLNATFMNLDAELDEDVSARVRSDDLEDAMSLEEQSKFETSSYIKQALTGIQNKKDVISSKTPLGVFAKVMGEKTDETMKVEREKLQLNRDNLDLEREMQKEKLMLEKQKVELEHRRLLLDEQLVEEKRADREHELAKIKLQQEFELKKFEMQLKFQNSKS